MSSKTQKKGGKSAIDEVVSREYTIHMHKRVRAGQTNLGGEDAAWEGSIDQGLVAMAALWDR